MDTLNFLKTNQISLSRFINLCLYEKNKGFYQNNRIGSHFITSPEISSVFGECIAIFFSLLLKKFKIKDFCELGPGNGTLMMDLILTINKFVNTPLKFHLYEKSNLLRSLQLSNLTNLNSKKLKIKFQKNFKLKKKIIFFF